ncbi:GIY-YIG catalytic domain-containing protein [Lishizhenia tianjinensis]|uniref:GIY-YIG catalytic domain-containing protein n=1 Tax=Lishizhenia tianjinensis TaxID=477690 RepID=A0A1I6XDG0_9FLAO|nr:GIY-YIG nuclease family protein [Lishizhenia tianjinensis]SFT36309.1 GIY-YIG catalytic domain-containing protein [Lishizhenia tianjinensis]
MKTTPYQEIIIDWTASEKVNSLNDFKSKFGNVLEQKTDFLYQIYGDHPVYGRNVLLYIGISKQIKGRMNQHLKGIFSYVHNKTISIGQVDEKYRFKLEKLESILIANHKPAFNKEYLHNLDSSAMQVDTQDDGKIIVINNGEYGCLQTSCTNFWWVDAKVD